MTISHRERAKKDLANMITGELTSVLGSVELSNGHPLSRKAISALSLSVVERIIGSDSFLERVAEFAPRKRREWLTTEEAARLSGFSRPFIVALIDSGVYGGQVTKTEKGHRRIAAGDFQKWMLQNRDLVKPRSDMPVTLDDIRSGPRDDDAGAPPDTPGARKDRDERRRAALALARDMGLG